MDHKLDEQVNIRLSSALKRAIELKSRAVGVPISALVRRAFELWVGDEWNPFVQLVSERIDTERKPDDTETRNRDQ